MNDKNEMTAPIASVGADAHCASVEPDESCRHLRGIFSSGLEEESVISDLAEHCRGIRIAGFERALAVEIIRAFLRSFIFVVGRKEGDKGPDLAKDLLFRSHCVNTSAGRFIRCRGSIVILFMDAGDRVGRVDIQFRLFRHESEIRHRGHQ